VYLCAVPLTGPKMVPIRDTRSSSDLLTDRSTEAGIRMWQDEQAIFLLGEMFLSKFISLPSISTEATPVFLKYWRVTCQGRWRQRVPLPIASVSTKFTSRSTLASSGFKSDGRIPGGYGL